jgi:hypothetical protein
LLSKPTKRLLEEIASLATDVGHELVDRPWVHIWTMALFDRCRSAFGAIRILADLGYGHEALALCRSLVTESLMLMELAAADEKRRADLLKGWGSQQMTTS